MDTEGIYVDEPKNAIHQEPQDDIELEVLSPQEAQAELKSEKPPVDSEEINGTALYVGAVLLVIACAVFAILKSISQGEPFFEYPAIIFAVLAGVAIYMFHKRENIGYLFGAIAFGVGALCLTLLYYINR